MENNKIQLKDVLDLNLLQKFQDNFAESMDVASVTVDMDGVPITKPSSYTSFCMDYTHSTQIGDDRCAASHKKGGEQAAKTESSAAAASPAAPKCQDSRSSPGWLYQCRQIDYSECNGRIRGGTG